MGDYGIDQRSGVVSGSWMDNQPGWFVDHQKLIILMDDVERDVFALRNGRGGRWNGCSDGISRFDPVFGLQYGPRVHRHLTACDQGLEPCPAHVSKR